MPKLIVLDKFGSTLETHELDSDLISWMSKNVASYKDMPAPPYSATLNGIPWAYVDHGQTLEESDEVVMTLEPGEPLTIALVVISVLSAAYAYSVASNIPQGYESTNEPGASIYAAKANANQARPSGLIREIAGKPTVYPDLICPPHRRYENNEEFLYLMLCVGAGYFDLQNDKIFISETPITSYLSDITATVFEPGDDVSGNEAHENWYQSDEINGLELTTATEANAGLWTVDASGDQFTSYLEGSVEPFPFAVNERFEMTTGSNQGFYEVTSITGGDNEIATVIGLARVGGDTGRLEATTQRIRLGGPRQGITRNIRQNIFNSTGTPSLAAATGESVEWIGVNGGINWEGPFIATPENETARYAEVDISFPQGLIDNDGSATVELAVEWREYGTSEWTTVSGTSYTAATYDTQIRTIEIDFGSAIRPEFRYRRVTKDSDDIQLVDLVQVDRLKCKLETPTSYPGVTTIAMRLRGTNALANTAENKINIRDAARKLPTLQEIQDEIDGTPYDLSSTSTTTDNKWDLVGAEFVASGQVTGPQFKPEVTSGTDIDVDFGESKRHMIVYDNGRIRFFTLSEDYDVQSARYTGYYNAGGADPMSAKYVGSGNHILTLRKQSDPSSTYYVTLHHSAIAYSPFTYSVLDDFLLGTEVDGRAISAYMAPDGVKFWVANYFTQVIHEYSCSTAFDLSTASYSSVTLDVSSQLGDNSSDASLDLRAIYFGDYDGDDARRFYAMRRDGRVYTYTLSTAGDITTATYDSVFNDVIKDQGVTSFAVGENSLVSSLFDTNRLGFAQNYLYPDVNDGATTRSISRFVANALYETMEDDAADAIDFTQLDALDTIWEGRGDYLDAEFIDETTLWEAINICLAPGYAEATVKEGKFYPVRTATDSTYKELYTPDVMVGGLKIDSDHYDAQEPDGVDVEYFSLLTNKMEVIQCRDTGDLGIRPKRIQAIGITDETKAWRYGMRERLRIKLKPSIYTFTTEMDALNSDYGDPIAIASDIFTSQYGTVTGDSGSEVFLDFDPVFGAGTHYAAFRNPEGQMSGLYTVEYDSLKHITLTGPFVLDFDPITDGSMDDTFMTLGTADEWGVRAIVRRITPSNDNMVEVTAEEYVAEIYANDESSPP